MTTPPRAPAPDAQFAALLSRLPPHTIALVKRCLPKLRSAVPCTHEIVYDYPNSVVVAFGMSERGYEAIISIAVKANALQLYFSKDLPDPGGLLQGTGTKVRFVTIKAASDLDRADIQALFRAAIAPHKPPARPVAAASRTRSTLPRQMIIKSASKAKKSSTKKTAKKTAPKKQKLSK